ncbi:MAG: hypothetical protein IK012_03960 [Fibrobacter sp.]|uniref:hypothetical protein n=1 Tax=Fibrobacter sp. TaxID=35828 RepID=UPI0025C04852|nr:hypothetical protein [Fibrobacter sp.]MBR4784393.1 hypothetical protein [Fibrobacter sp.]
MKLKTALFSTAIALAGLFTTALPLAAISALTACNNGNTAGTDEQANSITALDSALTVWLASDTLIVSEQHSTPCTDCAFDIPHLYPSDMTTYPKIQVENGALYNPKHDDFKSIVCENDSNWFSYSVFASDSLIQRRIVLPDSMSTDAFESECASDEGLFETDSIVVRRQHSHTCSLESTKQLTDPEKKQYVDPNWKRYVKLIVGICRE